MKKVQQNRWAKRRKKKENRKQVREKSTEKVVSVGKSEFYVSFSMLINDWSIYNGRSACCQSFSLIHSTINSRVCGAYIVCIFLWEEEILTKEFHLINSIIHLYNI